MLAIDCDTELYRQGLSLKERDIHRQNYLNARGWKVCRVFAANWFTDREKELDKIIRILEA